MGVKYLFVDVSSDSIYYSENNDLTGFVSTSAPCPSAYPYLTDSSNVVVGKNKFVFVGVFHKTTSLSSDKVSRSCYSSDGKNWSVSTSNIGTYIYGSCKNLAYGNNLYVCVSGSASAVSSDGISWTYSSDFDDSASKICYGNGVFIAVGNRCIYRTTDGKSWSKVYTFGSSYTSWTCSYGCGYFIVAYSKNVLRSTDGLSWSSCYTLGKNDYTLASCFYYNKFIIYCSNVNYYTTNGTSWETEESSILDGSYELFRGCGKVFADSDSALQLALGTKGSWSRGSSLESSVVNTLGAVPFFNVSFNANGGSGGGNVSVAINGSIASSSIPSTTKTGYYVSGWYTSSSGGSAASFPYSTEDDVTLYAHWTANTYTITFYANGGTGGGTTSVTYPNTVSAYASPSRAGYTFAGWYDAASGGNKFAEYTPTANKTWYAHWTANTVTVSFDAHGGSSVSSVTGSASATVSSSPTTTRTGYTFDGWYTSSAYTSQVSFPYVTTSSVTLHAKWTAISYTVAFNANGGTGTMENQSKTYNDGSTNPLTANAFVTPDVNKIFNGWNTSADGSGTAYADKSTANITSTSGATVTLYAQWAYKTYVVTYNGNGGTVSPTTQTWNCGVAQNVTATTWTRANYRFLGWTDDATAAASTKSDGSTDATVKYASGSSQTFTPASIGEAHTWYAVWERIVCRVNFDPSGGTVSPTYVDVLSGTTLSSQLSTMPTPTHYGYTHNSWNGNAAGTGTAYTLSSPTITGTTSDHERTIYSIQTGNLYYIDRGYYLNGTWVSCGDPLHCQCGTACEVTAPTREHYAFKGWKADWSDSVTSENGTGVAFWGTSASACTSAMNADTVAVGDTASASVYFKDLTRSNTDGTGRVKLIAKWERIKYTVTLNDSIPEANSEDTYLTTTDTSFDNFNGTSDETINYSGYSVKVNKGSANVFTLYAGLTYTLTTTFVDNLTSGTIAVLKGWGSVIATTSTANAVFSGSHTMEDAEDATQTWATNYKTVTVVNGTTNGQTTLPTITRSYGNGDTCGYWVTIETGDTVALEYDNWVVEDDYSHTDVATNPLGVQVGDDDVTVTCNWKLKRMTINVGIDQASYDAFEDEKTSSQSMYVYVYQNDTQAAQKLNTITVAYGESVYFRCDMNNVTSSYPLQFDGWYQSGFTSIVSNEKIFQLTNVTSNVSLLAKLNAKVTINKDIPAAKQSTVKAHLVLNGTVYSSDSAFTTQTIGSTYSIGVQEDNDSTVFVNWYNSTDTDHANPLLYEKNQSGIELTGTTNIKAYLLDSSQLYYVAFYNYNLNTSAVEAGLGQFTISSSNGEALTKVEYAAGVGATASDLPDGVFYKFSGTQKFSIGIAKTGSLEYLRLTRRKYTETRSDDVILTTEQSLTTIVNQNYVYTANWGTMRRTYVKASIRSGDGAKLEGSVGVGSAAYPSGGTGDGTYRRGGFEIGTVAEVCAYPYNGWKFEGWYWGWNATDGFTEKITGAGVTYEFNVPANFSSTEEYEYGDLVSYAAGSDADDVRMWRCTNEDGHTGAWDADDFEEAVMYAHFVTESIALYKWEGASSSKTLSWRSKVYALSKPSNLNSVRIDATGYTRLVNNVEQPSLTMKLASFSSPDVGAKSGDTLASSGLEITSDKMRRLPARRPERYFQVAVTNCHEIDSIIIGTSGEGLAT